MNATMINNREYVETLHGMESNINLRLLVHATKFYGTSLSDKNKQELFSLSIEDKIWLLNQYEEEIKFNKQPDLSDLY
jgi:hypothetical protein